MLSLSINQNRIIFYAVRFTLKNYTLVTVCQFNTKNSRKFQVAIWCEQPTVYRSTRDQSAEARRRAIANAPPLFKLPENFNARDMKPRHFLHYLSKCKNIVTLLIFKGGLAVFFYTDFLYLSTWPFQQFIITFTSQKLT